MKIICYTLLIACATSLAWGQVDSESSSSTVLTNESIIEMVGAKIPEQVIIAKIEVSKTNFKTELADLKLLSESGVPETVISEMIRRSAERPKPQRQIEYSSNDAEYGNLSEIAGKAKICLRVPDAKSREIIVKAINKQGGFSLLDDQNLCDFAIRFEMESRNVGSNALLRTVNNIIVIGRMHVYRRLPIAEGQTVGKIRIFWQKDKTQDFSGGLTFDKHPANSINDFLKAYRKVKR